MVEKEIYRMAQKSGKRKIAFRPSAIPYRTFIDSAVVLRGIEIVIEDEPLGMTPRKTSLTLTIEELEILFKSLNGELSICKQQYSWEEDWT